MTPEMLELARRNAARGMNGQPFTNVEFHLGTIDRLPLEDQSVDCVISNCVINLAPDKPAVFREIIRVLKPGGRLAVSDIALKQPLPPELADDLLAYAGCISGAILVDDYRQQLHEAGFEAVGIIDTHSDLNAYAGVENQSVCCAPPPEPSAELLPMAESGAIDLAQPEAASCCSASPGPENEQLHQRLQVLLERYNVNDFAASVHIYALKPR
jgi:arsenite methyltransferase